MILVSAFFEFRRDLAVREERRRELDFLEKVVVILVSHCLHTLTTAKSFLNPFLSCTAFDLVYIMLHG